MAPKVLNTAVIGLGNMGKNHVRVYAESAQSSLVAVSDLNEELGRAMAERYSCKYYRDHREMLDQERLDAVSVVVPSEYHHHVGLDVLYAGVNALIEKPIAMTRAEGIDLIAAAEVNKVKLMIGHVERFNGGVIRLKELIDSGMLGKIASMRSHRAFKMATQIKDTTVMTDLSVHDIDVMTYLLGEQPRTVLAVGGRAQLDDRDDHATILLTFNGTHGIVEVNWITPVRRRNLSVTGTEGYAELDYLKQTISYYPSEANKQVENFQELLDQFGNVTPEVFKCDERQPMEREISSFLTSILNNEPVLTTGEDGLRALEVALIAEEQISNARKA